MNLVAWMGWLVLAATAVALAALVTLHALPTGLVPWRNPVSQYGIGRFKVGYRVLTISMGLAGVAAAIATSRQPNPAIVVVLIAAFACARLVISWFPMDEPGTPVTPTGRWHGLLALITFLSVTAAALLVPGVVVEHHAALLLTARLVVLALVLMLISARGEGRRVFGLTERLFYATVFAWLIALGLAFIG